MMTTSLLQGPDLDQAVDARGGELGGVGAEGERGDGAQVGFDRLHVLAGGGVPDLDGLVPAAAGQALAVGAEGEGPDALVSLELLQFLLAVDVVDLDQAVERAGGELLAVGTEGDAGEWSAALGDRRLLTLVVLLLGGRLLHLEGAEFLAGEGLPELDAAVGAGGGDLLAVVAEGDAADGAG